MRSGERRWTEAELAKVRDSLAKEAEELRTDIERAESDIASRLGDAVGDAGDDQADVGGVAAFIFRSDRADVAVLKIFLDGGDLGFRHVPDGQAGNLCLDLSHRLDQ